MKTFVEEQEIDLKEQGRNERERRLRKRNRVQAKVESVSSRVKLVRSSLFVLFDPVIRRKVCEVIL